MDMVSDMDEERATRLIEGLQKLRRLVERREKVLDHGRLTKIGTLVADTDNPEVAKEGIVLLLTAARKGATSDAIDALFTAAFFAPEPRTAARAITAAALVFKENVGMPYLPYFNKLFQKIPAEPRYHAADDTSPVVIALNLMTKVMRHNALKPKSNREQFGFNMKI